MTTPPAFSPDQMQRIDHHLRDLCREIEERSAEHREVIGHALAVIARAVSPETQSVVIPLINPDGTFGLILCANDGLIEQLPKDVVGPELITELACMFRLLPHGTVTVGVWKRDQTMATLDVPAALAKGDRYPFLPIQDRLVAYIENKTGRSVRRIEIASDLWDNGYCYSDTVEVDYRDGDGDEIDVSDMAGFADDLVGANGDPGANTRVVIECTSAGITIS